MGDFRPSFEAAQAALPGTPMVARPHPVGAKGASVSLNEVAARIVQGMNDGRVRAWAIHTLKLAGDPQSNRARAQALLDALRSRAIYVPDPVNTEFMQAAALTLCLDEHGLCFNGGDCDDLSVALGAALSSVNVPVKVLGQAFKNEPLPSHVLLTVGTEDGWKKVDPSSKTFRVGEGFQATREWTIDPFEEANPNVVDGTMSGMFVGVGQVPGDWIPENSFLYKSWVQKWQQEIYELEKANNNLGAALVNITYTRGVSRPDNPYDPEPGVNGNPGKKIRDVTDFPTDGTWTQSMAMISMDLYDMGGKFVRAGHEAMARKRKILVDPKTNESVLERLPTDSYSTKMFVPYAPGNAPMSNMVLPEKIVAFYDAAGDLVSGMTESGVALTKEEVEARTKNPTGLALGPLVVFWIVVGVAFVSVSTVVIVMKNNNKAETLARLALDSEIVKCIADKKCSENVLSIEGHNAVEFKKAQTANDEANPFTGIAKSIGGIVTWLVIGGVAAGGFALLSPVIRKAFDEATKKKEPAPAPARLHAVKA